MTKDLTPIVARIVDQLVQKNYWAIVNESNGSRLTSDQLAKVVGEYGRKLVSPPDGTYENLDAIQIKGARTPTWSVRVPLWTVEEGRSDLTLELTIALGPDEPRVEVDDLHVL